MFLNEIFSRVLQQRNTYYSSVSWTWLIFPVIRYMVGSWLKRKICWWYHMTDEGTLASKGNHWICTEGCWRSNRRRIDSCRTCELRVFPGAILESHSNFSISLWYYSRSIAVSTNVSISRKILLSIRRFLRLHRFIFVCSANIGWVSATV